MIHALAWLGWVAAILVILSTTRNPWYLALVLAWIGVVNARAKMVATGAPPIPISLVRFGLFVVTFSTIFNGLVVHFGDTELFAIPEIIPFLGGPVTLEALTYGLLNGLVLTGMFAAFTVLNRALPTRALIRLVPRAFYPVAVVTSIAITFVPVTFRQLQQIREAQAVRGHQMRGLRDWLSLLMPLLVGGLERALQLSEAMTARGFASGSAAAHDALSKGVIVLGLALLLGGWLLRLMWGWPLLGAALLWSGVALVVAALWMVGRRSPRTIYRPEPWRGPDWLVMAGAALAGLPFLLSLPGLDKSSVYFYPYPALTLPTFSPLLGLATLGLLAPALLLTHSQPATHPTNQPSTQPTNQPSTQPTNQ